MAPADRHLTPDKEEPQSGSQIPLHHRHQGLPRLGLSALHPGDDRGRHGPRGDEFFTFYGLTLLKKKLDLKVSPLGNPAMEMPMFHHIGMPNLVSALRASTQRRDE